MFPLQKTILGLFALSNNSIFTTGTPTTANCPPFPSTLTEFSSSFQQPLPPSIDNEFKAHFIQHKWNENVSHITTGYIYNSPSSSKVRADETYDLNIASSIFDYNNLSADGLVNNVLLTFTPSIKAGLGVWMGFVNPGFPLWEGDVLKGGRAVFTGIVERMFWGEVAAWSFMYQSVIPVTVYLTGCDVVVGYDFFAPEQRTRVVTEFFNVEVGEIDKVVFELPG